MLGRVRARKRSLARASIFARASASLPKRSSRAASSSGIDIPSGNVRGVRRLGWPAVQPLRPSAALRSCRRARRRSALCRLALAWIFVPSSTRPCPSSGTPISRAPAARPERTAPRSLSETAAGTPRDRVVVGMIVSGNEAERHAVIGRPLELAARKNARRIPVDQKSEPHRGMIRCRAGGPDKPHSSPEGLRPSITSTTNRARCRSGNHSSTEGGSKIPSDGQPCGNCSTASHPDKARINAPILPDAQCVR